MQKLNLPEADLKVRDVDGEMMVFDVIRKKEVALTPEEHVRQHFVHLLINHLRYPRALINIESGISYFNTAKRSDIQVLNREGSHFMLVECKSPQVKLDRKALNQVSVYNKTLQASYVAITNGINHFIWKFELSQYIPLREFPAFPSA